MIPTQENKERFFEAMEAAKLYYMSCQSENFVPEKGLQRALYDAGSRVSTNPVKFARKLLAGIERVDRFYAAFGRS